MAGTEKPGHWTGLAAARLTSRTCQVALQAVVHGLLPVHGLQDTHMRYPVPHKGQNLVRVADTGSYNQAAIGPCLFNHLLGDEFAALEVTGNCCRDRDLDLSHLLVHPDAVA